LKVVARFSENFWTPGLRKYRRKKEVTPKSGEISWNVLATEIGQA
jgi:hypothetical protein